MTMVRGVRIVAAPCCGNWYALPRYLSVNFMSFEFWTDGWRVGSLMPNDSGLRMCKCGKFIRLRDLVELRVAEESDLPRPEHIPPERLPECIEKAADEEMEIAARFAYWRELNHAYRDVYRAHRDEEERQLEAAWRIEQRQKQVWWKRLVRWPLPDYVRSGETQITYPPLVPTATQTRNMEILADRLLAKQKIDPAQNKFWLAELYRELGQFDEAMMQITSVDEGEQPTTTQVIRELIVEKVTVPVRYRM